MQKEYDIEDLCSTRGQRTAFGSQCKIDGDKIEVASDGSVEVETRIAGQQAILHGRGEDVKVSPEGVDLSELDIEWI